jgi:hypothetical protein
MLTRGAGFIPTINSKGPVLANVTCHQWQAQRQKLFFFAENSIIRLAWLIPLDVTTKPFASMLSEGMRAHYLEKRALLTVGRLLRFIHSFH